MSNSGSYLNNNSDRHENKPSKEVLEASVKKIKCPACGFETEPYYMKFHVREKA